MRKMTLAAFVLFMSTLALGSTFQGKIINLVPDDEGTKVILQQSSKIVSLYSSSTSHNHEECLIRLQAAKDAGATVKIQTQDKGLAEIITIEVLK